MKLYPSAIIGGILFAIIAQHYHVNVMPLLCIVALIGFGLACKLIEHK